MLRKPISVLLLLWCSCLLTSWAEWKFEVTTTASPEKITLLAVPRDATAVKIANDIARNYPVLLVCYQQINDQLKIHAWNGKGWLDVPAGDYTNGLFFSNPPAHAIIVESADSPAPEILVPDGTWCESGNRLASTDPAVMIHLLGRYFDFPYRTWKDFSRRYKLPFEKVNPAFINTRLWHHYGEDLFKKRKMFDPKADLDKWHYLDITPPAPMEPVEIEKTEPPVPAESPAANPIPPEESEDESLDIPVKQEEVPLEAPVTDAAVDPFSDAAIPAARIIQ